MRKDFGAKPLVLPQPVLMIATYDENGKVDLMNAAWGGLTEENEISICLSADHKTVKNFEKTGAFTVSPGTASTVVACDYCGIVSGNKVEDKFEKSGLHATRSEKVNAPIIDELPVTLECKVSSYDPELCLLKGEIVNVCVDECVLTDGKVDLNKVGVITFDPFNHTYVKLGEVVGNAFKDGLKLK